MKFKGFTLIEVLVVVMIVAVLAVLIVPRIVSQSEKAVLAEAYQFLGATMRAQETAMRLRNASDFISLDNTNTTNWKLVGMQPPSTDNFIYSCNALSQNCSATRSDASSSYNGSVITLESNRSYACTGQYIPIDPDASNYSKKGCTI